MKKEVNKIETRLNSKTRSRAKMLSRSIGHAKKAGIKVDLWGPIEGKVFWD